MENTDARVYTNLMMLGLFSYFCTHQYICCNDCDEDIFVVIVVVQRSASCVFLRFYNVASFKSVLFLFPWQFFCFAMSCNATNSIVYACVLHVWWYLMCSTRYLIGSTQHTYKETNIKEVSLYQEKAQRKLNVHKMFM